ncbi:MAG: OB-fold nucleic acid binding domain-containing protein [archaeon]
MPLPQIKEKIIKNGSLSAAELDSKIKQKMDKLAGLISEEGAAHILANELGIKLFEVSGKLQVQNILAGMHNVEVCGKVVRKYELREFSTEKRSGKVASFLIADETGLIRVVLWNDQTDLFNEFNEGDTIRIKGAYVRENNDRKELHLREESKLEVNPKGVKIKAGPSASDVVEAVRKQIKDLAAEDQNVEVLATVVQIFDPNFFELCPECNKRVRLRENAFECEKHGKVEPKFSYVMNTFLDDGTDNVRAVFWRDQVQKLLGKTHEELLEMKDKPSELEPAKTDLLGNIIKVTGRMKKNETFDRLELVSTDVFRDINPDEEIAKLKAESEKAIEDQPEVPKVVKEEIKETLKPVKGRTEAKAEQTDIYEGTDKEVKEVKKKMAEDAVDLTPKEETLSIDDLEDLDEEGED